MVKVSEKVVKLNEKINSQKRVIELLSNEEAVKGLNNALKDFKEGRYKLIKNY